MYRSAAYEPADVGVGAVDPPPLPAQRLDRPGALDGLGEAVGHVGVGGVLAQVAGGRPAQVPPGADHEDRHREQQRQREQRADQQQRADHERRPVISAISISGTANRTLCDSASTSREVRVSRSPVPARSTVDSGMASTRSTKSSRSSASTRSPSRAEASMANRTSTACTTTNAGDRQRRSGRPRRSCVPCWIASTRSPSSHGAASPATAASTCRPSATASARGWRRNSVARVPPDLAPVRPPAAGRSSRPPPAVTVRGVAAARSSSSSRWVPSATTRPSLDVDARGRPGRAPAGWWCRPPWCGRRGRRRSRAAIRASVCASTALVGSTSTSTSRVGDQRPGQPQPLLLAAGELAPALGHHRVQPVGQRLDDVRRAAAAVRRRPGRSSAVAGRARRAAGRRTGGRRCRPPGSARAPVASVEVAQRHAGQRAVAVGVAARAGRRSRPRRPGAAAAIAVSRPGRTDHAGLRVDQLAVPVGGAAGVGRVGQLGLQAAACATTRRAATWPRVILSTPR